MKINPDDFLLSGAIESALNFFYFPMLGAMASVKAEGFFVCDHGVCRVFVDKNHLAKAKDKWLKLAPEALDKKFANFMKKWAHKDIAYYNLATGDPKKWRERWIKLNQLDFEQFLDAYEVETLDNFAEEIKKQITTAMTKAGVDLNHFNELISPAMPTKTQQAIIDRAKLKTADYLKKYWYINGTWAGGELLSQDFLSKIPQETITIDFTSRSKLHDSLNRQLDKTTRDTLHAIRQLTLWREERKTFQQRSGVAMASIIRDAASDLNTDTTLLEWVSLEEIDSLLNHPNQFKDRLNYCVLAIKPGGKDHEILSGNNAFAIVRQFNVTTVAKKLQGTTASPGLASGLAKVVIKAEQFDSFKQGEVLITTMTRPEFLPLMRRAAAIVTDEGGLTSHAAIVSRELGIPCIVGTKIATRVLKDGDLVEVNANTGIIRKL